MSRAAFEKLLSDRGFQPNACKGVVDILMERQYVTAKTLLTALDATGGVLSEESVNRAFDHLFPRKNVYSATDKDQLAAVNSQSLPEIKNPIGPPVEQQLKYLVSHAAPKSTNKQLKPASEPVVEDDVGPTDETVFASKKSKKSIEFRGGEESEVSNIDGENGSRKRMASDSATNEDADDRKRVKM